MAAAAPGIVEIHTDGACRGNPGPGGWGALLHCRGKSRELSGAVRQTTNNRMELAAAIAALAALKRPSRIRLVTDSRYLRDGICQWLPKWKKNGWRTSAKKPVRNEDLWRSLDAEITRHRIEWHWVRGHSGNPGNERADRLANVAIDQLLSQEEEDSRGNI